MVSLAAGRLVVIGVSIGDCTGLDTGERTTVGSCTCGAGCGAMTGTHMGIAIGENCGALMGGYIFSCKYSHINDEL